MSKGRVCRANGIERRLTKPYRPWTNGQAERMVRTLKEATVRGFHYATAADLETHARAVALVHNLAKRLKSLRWRTPFQSVCAAYAKAPERFKTDPHHLIPGPCS
ncbi:hypothetical protein BH11ARM2_BH11ARM2_08230 [soil metagenome]